LTTVGVISKFDEIEGGNGPSVKRILRPKPEEAPLILSKQAQDRVYFPEGVLNHHHAVQFITFSPPFELSTGLHDDIHNLHQRAPSINSQNSQYGNFRDDMLSSSLDSEYSDLNHPANNVVASLGVNGRSPSATQNILPLSPKSVTNPPMIEPSDRSGGQGAKSSHRGRLTNDQECEIGSISGKCVVNEDGLSSGGVRGLFSKLNCCRSKDALMISDQQLYQLKPHHMSHHGNSILPATSLTSLSEEEEQQWLEYSMQPIAEDQSLAGAHSVVSMSAPLLSSAPASNASKQQQHGYRSATTTSQYRQPQSLTTSGNGYGFGRMKSEF
jgi:hypothetical protein